MLKTKQCDYKRLYEKYVGQMYSYGKALGVDDDALYDLIHDVFLHFFEHQNEIVDNDNVKYYLFRCLKNRMISEKRKEVTMEDIDESDDYLFSITVSGLDYIEEEEVLFSGDTLFAGSVGRTDFPTGSMSTLVRSVKERLLSLPEDTQVYPGHMEATTIGFEKENNPFL